MKKLKRRYVYEKTRKEIMDFFYKNSLKYKSPNKKENFAYALDEYIKVLKQLADE